MAAILIKDKEEYIGTAAERAAMVTTATKAGSTFEETDTGLTYTWSGAAWFVKTSETVASTIIDGGSVTIGAKADNRSASTDTTAVSAMSVLKEISYMEQNPASRAVTGTVTAKIDQVTANANEIVVKTINDQTTFIGRSGSKCFKATANFTRPADANIYTADDAITNVSAAIAVAFTDAGDIVTLNNHGLINGTVVSFATIVTTTGISTSTNYYVVGATTNTFQLSASYGGAALPLTTNGTGTMNACTLCVDLSSFGAVAGQYYQITNARIISSVKGTALDMNANLWIFNTIFTGTLDNAALSIDDITAQTGGVVIPCTNAYRNALNHRCVSDCGMWKGKLAAADTKLYFTPQASNAYTPQSGEVLYVVFEGDLL